jgi:cell wall-associated NlpC family hydrolase
MPTTTALTAGGLAAVVLLPVLAVAGIASSDPACGRAVATPDANQTWDAGQRRIAAAIVAVGVRKGVPASGQVIALATAMQESALRNLPGGDADSIGVFQQRPSQDWGTPAQLTSVSYQSGKFYDALLAVPGWQAMPLTKAAQAVQHSAYPNAYARWTGPARSLAHQLNPGVPPPDPPDSPPGDCGLPDVAPGGSPRVWPSTSAARTRTGVRDISAAGAVAWALAQLGTRYSYGGDCTGAHSGNPVHECDCSSLVQQAYRAVGIDLPRTTTEQARTGTDVPSADQLRPGDLIFIPGTQGTRQAPDHVGLYIGHGLLVHAPTTGDIVKISTLSSWQPDIVAIRRIHN